MLNIGPQELLLILVIALIVVGPHRLPTLGRSIGRGLREIRKAQDEVKRTIQVNLDEEPAGDPERGAAVARERSSTEPASTDPGDATADAGDVPVPTGPDPVPLASEPPPPSEVTEVSRALGRSLHELRRAREEIRKSFRVDLGEPTPRPGGPKAPPAAGNPGSPPPADEAPTG
jgi:Tat protein translocase TatB subunit